MNLLLRHHPRMFLLFFFSFFPGGLPLQEGVQMETLANGMRILVLPQGEAPVAAFHLLVRAGSRNELPGKGGLAHLAEHLVFHGSDRLGSRNWPAEQRALQAADRAWKAWKKARDNPSPRVDEETLADLRQEFLDARAEAGALGDPGAFDRLIERAGGRDQNASADADSIRFTVSLPANRAEQWFWLMRELIERPVMRGFYTERDVIEEERRMRLESNPLNALLARLYAAAFPSHPYGRPVFGAPGEIAGLDRGDLLSFWRGNVVPRGMILAVVGRVEPAAIFRLAREYFGGFRPGLRPAPPPGPSPGAEGGKRVELESDAPEGAGCCIACWPSFSTGASKSS
ncbi:MAG: M16 family metallopeptidase [Planctomycetota bacterium]